MQNGPQIYNPPPPPNALVWSLTTTVIAEDIMHRRLTQYTQKSLNIQKCITNTTYEGLLAFFPLLTTPTPGINAQVAV
jgi:hypothetical protein